MGRILGVQNQQGELLEFKEPVKISDKIEQWLKRTEQSMKFNVSRTLQHAWHSHEDTDFNEWILLWPVQFLLAVLEIQMTRDLEKLLETADIDVVLESKKKFHKTGVYRDSSRMNVGFAQRELQKKEQKDLEPTAKALNKIYIELD